jgi:hypothetical protein
MGGRLRPDDRGAQPGHHRPRFLYREATMKPTKRRTIAVAALLIGAISGIATAMEALPCADFISSGIGDDPLTGHLTGTESVTETLTFNIKTEPGGVGSTITSTKTVTYEVGIYRMSDGSQLKIDCRTYTIV